MPELPKYIPKDSKAVEAIYAAYKKAGDAEQPRGYLGASIIGHSCARYLWYNFRYCCKPEFSGRMYRLFSTGDHEEGRFVADLRSIGCEVHDVGADGKQFAVSAIGGHFGGHMDGYAIGIPEAPKTWHVLEFKTHNTKSFAKLKKEGVKKSKPKHFGQMQTYMGLAKADRALYLAKDKDNDELYSERVEFDKAYFDSLMERAGRIIKNPVPSARISDRPDYYECSYCDARTICFGSADSALPVPEINCRQCCHATPEMDGDARWVCEKQKRGLSVADQAKACDDMLPLPGLIVFAEPTNSGDNWIEFQKPNGEKFWVGKGKNIFSAKELMLLTPDSLTNEFLQEAKRDFGIEINETTGSVLARYPEGDCRTVWRGKKEHLFDAWLNAYKIEMPDEKQICREVCLVHRAAEYEGGRVAIIWTDPQSTVDYDAEIREGVS